MIFWFVEKLTALQGSDHGFPATILQYDCVHFLCSVIFLLVYDIKHVANEHVVESNFSEIYLQACLAVGRYSKDFGLLQLLH